MSTIVHFDIGTENNDRAKSFYEKLFQWKFELFPGPMNYYLIETRDLDGNISVGGGMAKRESSQPKGIINYFGVSSLDKSVERVKQLGGKIIQEKSPVPGRGYLAMCRDTEDNVFGLFEEDPKAV